MENLHLKMPAPIAGDNDLQIVFGKLTGNVLAKRYKIGDFVEMGSYAQIYTVIDKKKPNGMPLIIKIANHSKRFLKETKAMRKVYK